MAVEIEAKIKVSDHDGLRERLEKLGAVCQGEQLETNIYFDMADSQLRKGDRALRLRCVGGEYTLAYKGPAQPSKFKQREEIQTGVADGPALVKLLGEVGFEQSLVFEKRRESWVLDECCVELDVLPLLGTFVEVEGPSEAAIGKVVEKLGLAGADLVNGAYPILLREYLEQTGNCSREIRLEQKIAN